MKILLHICCGPCTIFPLKKLRADGFFVQGLFFNPNIHPYLEYRRRMDTLRSYALSESFDVTFDEEYPMEEFLENVALRRDRRCRHCYEIRLSTAADFAKKAGYGLFTTTLLYSTYQNHEMIAEVGRDAAKNAGIEFHYDDYRIGWREGIVRSKEMGMYRQQYCGCVYSEKDRYIGKSQQALLRNPFFPRSNA